MFRGQFVRPLEITPRNEPAGALSEHGVTPMPREQADRLHNPIAPNPQILEKGGRLFRTDCAPCHGNDGKGDGSVLPVLAVKPADLTNGKPAKVSDGYIFWTIRNGDITMPPYGDTLSARETWEVVLYVRYLQQQTTETAYKHESDH
jgi:mono/diheme cytochrome c family protein